MSGAEKNSIDTNKEIKKCTDGLIQKFESPVRGIDVSLEVINNRQTVITDKLTGENEKFQKVAEEYKITDMVQKTKVCTNFKRNCFLKILLRGFFMSVRTSKRVKNTQHDFKKPT